MVIFEFQTNFFEFWNSNIINLLKENSLKFKDYSLEL